MGVYLPALVIEICLGAAAAVQHDGILPAVTGKQLCKLFRRAFRAGSVFACVQADTALPVDDLRSDRSTTTLAALRDIVNWLFDRLPIHDNIGARYVIAPRLDGEKA